MQLQAVRREVGGTRLHADRRPFGAQEGSVCLRSWMEPVGVQVNRSAWLE